MFLRRQIPIFIVMLCGTIFILQRFIPHYPFNMLQNHVSLWFDIIAVFAIFLGGLNLLKLQMRKVIEQAGSWT